MTAAQFSKLPGYARVEIRKLRAAADTKEPPHVSLAHQIPKGRVAYRVYEGAGCKYVLLPKRIKEVFFGTADLDYISAGVTGDASGVSIRSWPHALSILPDMANAARIVRRPSQ